MHSTIEFPVDNKIEKCYHFASSCDILKMSSQWCSGVVVILCLIVSFSSIYLVIFPLTDLIDSNRNTNLTRHEILQWFAHSEPTDCEIYHEFGGVLNRMYKPAPALFFLDGQKSVCLEPVSLAPPSDNCIVYSFGNNAEWSFDEAMQSYGCHVFTFDPTMR